MVRDGGIPARVTNRAAELWGEELQLWRKRAGLTQGQLARQVYCDQSWISALENGKALATQRKAEELDEALHTDGVLGRNLEYVLRESVSAYHPDWFTKYVELERKAIVVREWAPYGMPGLLQTEEHMRAMFATGIHAGDTKRIEELTEGRLRRQELLYGTEPIQLHVLIDEAVLRRQVGSVQAVSGQLRHLLQMSKLPNVVLQVVPLSPRSSTPPGSLMTFLDMPGGKRWFYSEALNASYCTDESAEIAQHVRLYDQTAGSALSVHESRDRVRRVMGEMINMAQPSVPYSDLKVFKSSYSSDSNGGCVGSSSTHLDRGIVPVVDTTLGAASPVLAFTTGAFASFVSAVKSGEFAEGEKYVTL